MKVEFVVLYVKDVELSKQFWVEKVGMIVKNTTSADNVNVYSVGFEEQDFCFQLVDLSLMQDNPDKLNLGTSSILFKCEDLEKMHAHLTKVGVKVTDISNHFGMMTFTMFDHEENAYAVC